MDMATITGCHPERRTSLIWGLRRATTTQRGIRDKKSRHTAGDRYQMSDGKEKTSNDLKKKGIIKETAGYVEHTSSNTVMATKTHIYQFKWTEGYFSSIKSSFPVLFWITNWLRWAFLIRKAVFCCHLVDWSKMNHFLNPCFSFCCVLPLYSYSMLLIPARRDRVIKSPRLAAMGVATLSGLTPTFLEPMITPIITRPTQRERMQLNQWASFKQGREKIYCEGAFSKVYKTTKQWRKLRVTMWFQLKNKNKKLLYNSSQPEWWLAGEIIIKKMEIKSADTVGKIYRFLCSKKNVKNNKRSKLYLPIQ